MEIWILLTIAAAGVQAAGTALQKHLTERLTVFGATFARFLFGLLLILVALAALSVITQQDIPVPSPVFLGYAWAGGLLQLFGNALLLHLLGLSTFTVGMTYTKTEVIQTVAVSFVVLGEHFWPYNAIGCF